MGLESQSAKIPQSAGKINSLPDGLNSVANLDESCRSSLSGDQPSPKWKEEALTSLHLFETARRSSLHNNTIQLAFADDIELPKEGKPNADIPKASEKVEKSTYAVRAIEHQGEKIPVQVNTEGQNITYIVGGKSYRLEGEHGRFCIPAGTKGAPYHGPVKLHVLTESAKDLAALQATLIPFLMNKRSIDWKTIDPNYGIGMGERAEVARAIGEGQNAKAFTIYVPNIETATQLQTELDKVLTDNGLLLANKSFDTTDNISGESNRVGIVREKFIPYTSEDKQRGFLLDPVLERQLANEFRTKFGLTEDQEFTPGQLNQIEMATGLAEDTLTRGTPSDRRGGRRALMITATDFSQKDPNYVPEGNKEVGDLTGRAALYALAKRYGIDQVDLARSEIQVEISLPPGQEISIGRKHQTITDNHSFSFMPDSHAKVGRNEDGTWYLQDLGSRSGMATLIHEPDLLKALEPNQKILITPETKISFGGYWLAFVPVPNPDGLHGGNTEGVKEPTKAKIALAELDRKTEKFDLSVSHTKYDDLNNEDIRYLVGHFPELKDVDFSGKQIIDDKSLFQIGYIKHLQSLGLNSTGTTDGDLAFLGNCAELKSLGLNGTAITDAGLAAVGKFTQLTDLGLSHTAITDLGLASLNHLNQLRYLNLSHTSITNDGLAEVVKLKDLESLDLRGVNLTDNGLKHLYALAGLGSLYLDGNNLSITALAELRKSLPHCLISLDRRPHSNTDYQLLNDSLFANQVEGRLSDTDVTDEGLLFLADPKNNLFGLYLANTNIGDQGLKNLGQKPDLISLDLSSTNITNGGIKSVREFKKVQSLLLANTSLTDDCMKDICHMKQLEVLVLGDTDITDAGLQDIHRLSNLKLLRIEGTDVTAAGLEQLKKLPNLVELHIDDSKMSKAEIEAFKKSVNFRVYANYDKLNEAKKDVDSLPDLWISQQLEESLKDRTKLDANASPLASLAEVNSFSQEFISRWQKEAETADMEELNLHVKETGDNIHKLQKVQEERLKQEAIKVKDELRLPDNEATKIAESRLSNDPEWNKLKQEIDKLSADYNNAIRPFERVIGAIDFTVRHLKMPKVEYGLYNMPSDHDAAGSYRKGTGKLYINANSYKLANEAKLAGTTYHELVHAEQDALVVRAVADQVLGDKDLSKDETIKEKQIAQIQDIYKQLTKDAVQLTGGRLDRNWALSILEVRGQDKNKVLSPQEKERVEIIIKGQNEYKSNDHDLLEKDFYYVRDRIGKLQQNDEGMLNIYHLCVDLSDTRNGKSVSETLFDSDKPPADVERALTNLKNICTEKRAQGHALIDTACTDNESLSIIINALTQRLHNINHQREEAARKYYDNPIEKEAQITGNIVYARIEKIR